MPKPIIIASDHGGFELKQKIKQWLVQSNIAFDDVGTDSDADVDYPVFVKRAVKQILYHNTAGIIICGSGIGVSIAANRYRGIRAALATTEVTTQLCRQHNDANVLCLGGRILDHALAIRLVQIFLETPFLGGKYQRRNELLEM